MRVRGGASVTNLFPTQKQSLKRFGRADEGQALVLTALALVVLLLMAGLGVDVGYLRYQKQQLQKAADAGALAGASAYAYNGDWHAAAVADISANGFTTTTTNGLTITVNSPPQTAGDPFLNQSGYVEVIVKQNQPTFFMRVSNVYAVPVSARAVASAIAPGSGCLIALDPTHSGTFSVVGNITISSTCSIYVNSSSATALVKTVPSSTVAANYIGLVGDQQSGLTGVVSQESYGQDPVTEIAPLTDPLANVPPPHYDSNCTYRNFSTAGGRISPGTYCNGITITGSGAVTFASGDYILRGGGLTVTGASSLSGSDVMFYLTGDSTYPYAGITMSGSETASLSAPTTGPQAGMLFFQDRSMPPITSPGSTFGGSRGAGYTGAIYFPTTAITYKGNASSTSTPTIIVGYQLTFRGGDTNIKNYTYLPSGGGPITSAILVE